MGIGLTVWGHRVAFERGWGLLKWDHDNSVEDEFDHDLSLDDRIARLNVFEGFAGAGGNPDIHAGWSQAARDRGHDVKTNEIIYPGNPTGGWTDKDLGYMPDLPGDILDYTADDIIRLYGGKTPDVSFWSPPCEGHSIGARMQGWSDWKGEKEKKAAFNRARNTGDAAFFQDLSVGPTPTNEAALQGRGLMNQTFGLVDQLQDYRTHHEGRDTDDPMYWWVENPTGMMRYQPELGMRSLVSQPGTRLTGARVPPPSITHASYTGPLAEELGFPRHRIPGHPDIPARKRTDLWSNAQDIWTPRPLSPQGLHEEAPELDMSLEELQAKFGKTVEEVPKRPAPGKGGGAGVYHQWGPRGSKSGTQGIGSHTLPGGVTMPEYQMRSLIPYGLGEDAILAVERALRGETPPGQLF